MTETQMWTECVAERIIEMGLTARGAVGMK